MGPHYYDGGWGMGWIWGLLMFLFWAAFIGLLIWGVLRLGRSGAFQRPSAPQRPIPHGSARDILDRRYAAGEIDAATYEDMRARLEGSRPAGPPSQDQTEQNP